MPELLIELFSEEIPARMQAGAAGTLARLVGEALGPLQPRDVATFHGPRRIALAATLSDSVPAAQTVERGPRASAPPQALEGFLRKHGATREQLTEEGGHFVLTRSSPATPAAALIAGAMPGLLRRFAWPKSMRWGNGSGFVWVRPLRRILCLLDGTLVPFDLRDGADDGHGLASGTETEGHRFHAPGAFGVNSLESWRAGLLARHVVPDAAERRRRVAEGVARLAAAEGLTVVPDDGLLDEVAGLVEWPVPLLGRIDDAYMDLPAEVMQVSMRVNQRYFALRDAAGRAAPRFAFAANIEAVDGGAAIVAGNERVLRARFSDARHFWDLDRKTPLADRVAALDGITFHAKLGTQAARVSRIEALARHIAPLVGADPALAARAAHLCKADLTTGMVGEFPEVQGVMGGYYAAHDGEPAEVAAAIRDHYTPRGPGDAVPTAPVTVAVALADKIDQLAAFFSAGEVPTGSGDPFALRRAGLGVIRIIRENGLRLPLGSVFEAAGNGLARPVPTQALLEFVADRLRIQLRGDGARHDVLAAVFAAGADDDLVRLLARTDAVAAFLEGAEGRDLLAGARRAANILRIENKKDGPHRGAVDPALLTEPAERALADTLLAVGAKVRSSVDAEDDAAAMQALATLRPRLDAFFDDVTVNAPDAAVRTNRLRLLADVGAAMSLAADFSRIEG
ncbi:MAG: glycine--tRNA ligase subunit beta [Janthinobacterium lividum]